MALFDKKEPAFGMVTTPFEQQMAELEQRRTQLLMQLGMTFLMNNTEESATGTPYEENVKALLAIDNEKTLLEQRQLFSQGMRKCKKCGNVLTIGSVFCNQCGEKQESLPPEETSGGQRFCSQCGMPVIEGTSFCTSCGSRLDGI